MEPTIDPTTNIINRTEEYIEYLNTEGKQWRIYGKCNACGACELETGDPPFASGSVCIKRNNNLLPDGSFEIMDRVLYWFDVPGVSGACIEQDFDKRKDMPATPDAVNDIPECPLSGVWISGN
jgi:hypothetical protein